MKPARWVIRLSTSSAATWVIRHVASRLDPLIFKASNGRFTSMGPPAMPMLTMTATGRRSGQPRSVQLVCLEHGGDPLVVASAMGQQRHPAWRYNIEADPRVQIQMRGERFEARAQLLTDSERENVWAEVRRAIPQLDIYQRRTDRTICVFRLRRVRSQPTDEASIENNRSGDIR